MELKNKVVVLDLETTGTWIKKDRIIEIAMIKCEPDGTQSTYDKRVNPKMPIPKFVAHLTGISDDDVKDAPLFKDIAQEVLDFIGDANFAGFNIERFDLPLLVREIRDAGYGCDWGTRNIYDAQKVYHLNEKRDLTAAYKFYCQKGLDNAHSAMADTKATLEVLESQIEKYVGKDGNINELLQYDYKVLDEFYDSERKFRWWDGKLYMMFGKYAHQYCLQELVKRDRGYLEWVLSANFSEDIKALIEEALNGRFPVYEADEK